ncbi:phosphopantetheine-binding protein [Pseudomonas simiae]|uniref:phosphopantetheine-binding protein n=1 Tax=Pseudomonas simiae TaxID=321846 RepID=UPI003D6B8809
MTTSSYSAANSITATQVVARLRESLGLELNLRMLFESTDPWKALPPALRSCSRTAASPKARSTACRAKRNCPNPWHRTAPVDHLATGPPQQRLHHPRRPAPARRAG